jgi:hypothetical protein
VEVGALPVAGETWNFDGYAAVGPGPWGSVTVTNTSYAPSDPLCCPSLLPETVTYTWTGTALVPDGTPPGH